MFLERENVVLQVGDFCANLSQTILLAFGATSVRLWRLDFVLLSWAANTTVNWQFCPASFKAREWVLG